MSVSIDIRAIMLFIAVYFVSPLLIYMQWGGEWSAISYIIISVYMVYEPAKKKRKPLK